MNFASSAKSKGVTFWQREGKSLTKARKKNCPRMLPWSTPLVTGIGSEISLFTLKDWDLIDIFQLNTSSYAFDRLHQSQFYV